MRRALRWSLLGFLASVIGGCHTPPANEGISGDDPSVLPLRSLRLYENGVGYFEREGVLTGGDGASLGVPASHVDDALKSLLVLSRGDAKVSGIEFASVVSDGAARSLAGLPLEGETPVDYKHVLKSLIGFRIEVVGSAGVMVRGRLLNVEMAKVRADASDNRAKKSTEGESSGSDEDDSSSDDGDSSSDDDGAKRGDARSSRLDRQYSLLVVSDDGALVRLPTSDVKRIQPLDAEFSARLQTAADALGGRAAQLGRELRVRASSREPVRIGYIAETPVWRSTYRLVLPPEGKRGVMQGWALVHNDTDEAWRDISIELVNGAPNSFLFPLAAPRYLRRELSTPEEELSTVPQLALQTPDGLWGDHIEVGSVGTIGYGSGSGGGQGYGSGYGRLSGSHSTRSPSGAITVSSTAISIGDLARTPEAEGKDEGRLFSYRLSERVSLRAHGSALLPFIRSAIAARRLTRFNDDGAGHSTVRFQNDSPYILPAGPVAIFEEPGFAGETVIQRMAPTERVFLDYGTDLDVTMSTASKDVSHTTQRVIWDAKENRLEEHFVAVSTRTLTLENHSKLPRAVARALSNVVNNAKVEGADELDYDDSASEALAIVEAPGQKKVERVLHITEARETSSPLASLKAELLAQLSTAEALPAPERATLKAAVPKLTLLEHARQAVEKVKSDQKTLDADLARNQEHLKATHGSKALQSPIEVRVVAIERSIEQERKNLALAEARVTELGEAVAASLLPLVKK
jgi:hypothetical protein